MTAHVPDWILASISSRSVCTRFLTWLFLPCLPTGTPSTLEICANCDWNALCRPSSVDTRSLIAALAASDCAEGEDGSGGVYDGDEAETLIEDDGLGGSGGWMPCAMVLPMPPLRTAATCICSVCTCCSRSLTRIFMTSQLHELDGGALELLAPLLVSICDMMKSCSACASSLDLTSTWVVLCVAVAPAGTYMGAEEDMDE